MPLQYAFLCACMGITGDSDVFISRSTKNTPTETVTAHETDFKFSKETVGRLPCPKAKLLSVSLGNTSSNKFTFFDNDPSLCYLRIEFLYGGGGGEATLTIIRPTVDPQTR
jgi:hypothetical protein